MTKKEPKRDNKGRFASKKDSCPIKKAKNWLCGNKNNIIAWLIVIFVIWAIITGIMWAFMMKTMPHDECDNETHTYWVANYNATTGITEVITIPSTYEYCYTTFTKVYYTLPEITGIQWKIITESISGFGQWIWSHPVI